MAFRENHQQPSFFEHPELDAAVSDMAASGVESRGAVFTRREVVDFILDLAAYTADKPLETYRLLEPSMGHGDFLVPALERLLAAYRRNADKKGDVVRDLGDCVTAVELHRASYDETRKLVMQTLATVSQIQSYRGRQKKTSMQAHARMRSTLTI